MKRKTNGFTLVELLAVIVILALIMALVVPSVLNTTGKAKKEAFYLYGQNIQSKAEAKYIQDVDNDTTYSSCKVYDIDELYKDSTEESDVENTEYEGWAKVERISDTSSTERTAVLRVTNSNGIQYINYCITTSSDCTPSESYKFEEGSTSVDVSKVLTKKDDKVETLCVNYSYGDKTTGKLIQNQGYACKSYNDATANVKSYSYNVTLTYKSRDYAVENLLFNNNLTQSKFNDAIDDRNDTLKKKNVTVNLLAITEPKCDGDTSVAETKGATTNAKDSKTEVTTTHEDQTKTVIKYCSDSSEIDDNFIIKLVTNGGGFDDSTGITWANGVVGNISQCANCDSSVSLPNPTRYGYIFDGWYYDKAFKNKIEGNSSKNIVLSPKTNSENCITGYNDVSLYAKWKLDESKTTTSTTQVLTETTSTTTTNVYSETTTSETTTKVLTEDITTTIKDVTDYTVLLDSLIVTNYSIDFSPVKNAYEITIPYAESAINLSYALHSPGTSDATLLGSTSDLVVGDNLIIIRVTNRETLNYNSYRLVVSRLDAQGLKVTQPTQAAQEEWTPESGLPDPSLDESNASLKQLLVSGYTLPFDTNVYDYDLEVDSSNPLLLTVQAAADNAYINIDGNKDLEDGSVVTIYVQSPNGYYYKNYKINIKYKKETSNKTKYLRNVTIVAGIVMVIVLLVIMSNKKHNLSIIKKKNASNDNPSSSV